jgi:PhoD-like phosphatase
MRQRALAGEGVYGVKLFDFARPVGQQEVPERQAGIDIDSALGPPLNLYSNQTVAVFVLDVRTSKSPWKRFQPDFEGDFLGEKQWQWFEKSIRRSRAAVNVVVNGLQVHANRFPDGNVAESWSQFPKAQQRLFDTVLALESPVVLISGDVHMAQLLRKDCVRKGDMRRRRSLVEMTTR